MTSVRGEARRTPGRSVSVWNDDATPCGIANGNFITIQCNVPVGPAHHGRALPPLPPPLRCSTSDSFRSTSGSFPYCTRAVRGIWMTSPRESALYDPRPVLWCDVGSGRRHSDTGSRLRTRHRRRLALRPATVRPRGTPGDRYPPRVRDRAVDHAVDDPRSRRNPPHLASADRGGPASRCPFPRSPVPPFDRDRNVPTDDAARTGR